MKVKKSKVLYVIVVLILCSVVSIFFWRITANRVSPSIDVSNNYKWKKIDTEYCRIYYHQEIDEVKELSEKLDEIYMEVYNKFNHHPKPNNAEDGLYTILLLSDEVYKLMAGVSSAGWNGEYMLINVDKNDVSSSSFESTLIHETIHAMTLSSDDTKVTSIPKWFSEGIAQYYQFFDQVLLEQAIKNNQILKWKDIEGFDGTWHTGNIPLKYTQAASIYYFLIQNYNEEEINNIFYVEGTFYGVLEEITNKSIEELEKEWIKFIYEEYL